MGTGTGATGLRTNLTGVLLADLRVLDLCDGDADAVTRLFADLGADVLKVEPPGGSAAGRSRRVAGAACRSH
jgi:crotonobetainyl-CoA:carnitine CoA-transferase CaiB-like acyl-CoA transferase